MFDVEKRFVVADPGAGTTDGTPVAASLGVGAGVDPRGNPPALRPANGIRPATRAVRWQRTVDTGDAVEALNFYGEI